MVLTGRRVTGRQGVGRLGRTRKTGGLFLRRPDEGAVRATAEEQTQDGVLALLRWSAGGFCFRAGAADPDDVGVSAAVEVLLAEGHRRPAGWPALAALVDRGLLPSLGEPTTDRALTRRQVPLGQLEQPTAAADRTAAGTSGRADDDLRVRLMAGVRGLSW